MSLESVSELPGSQREKKKETWPLHIFLFSKQRKHANSSKNKNKKGLLLLPISEDLSLGTLQWQPQGKDKEVTATQK